MPVSETNGELYEAVTDHCEKALGSAPEYPFTSSSRVYKVAGKMFVCIAEEKNPVWLSIKLPPEEGLALRAAYPGVVTPGYHLNKQHWNTVVLDGSLGVDEVLALTQQSYDTVVNALPRRLRPTP
jgi:predicted DNA-binding protein (MmcQ/YjbR family)